MQRAVVFVVLVCLAAAHLAVAGDTVPQLCVMSMQADQGVELRESQGKWSIKAVDPGLDNLGDVVITAEVMNSKLPVKSGTFSRATPRPAYCCRSTGADSLHCRPLADSTKLCFASKAKCTSKNPDYKILPEHIHYKEFACSDLANWKADKGRMVHWFPETIIIKEGDQYACCARGKTRYSCGPISDPKAASLVNWQHLQLTSLHQVGQVSATYLNSINKLESADAADGPLQLSVVNEEATQALYCANMLKQLKSNELPLVFLAMTDMMIQQTKRIFGKHDKANLLSKTLLRSYVRFYMTLAKQKTTVQSTLESFQKWWDYDATTSKGPAPVLPKFTFTQDSSFSCMLADALFTQDIERLEANTKRNERIKGNIMFGVKVATSLINFGAKAAATAFGGPAAGAAAGAISSAIFDSLASGLDSLLERNNAVGKIRRDARSAILEGYQTMLYEDQHYKADCANVVQSYLDVVYKYLTADDTSGNAWNEKCQMCIPDLRVNHLDDYGHAFALMDRMQGHKQRTIGEIKSYLDMAKELGKEFIEKNVDRAIELKEKLDDIKESEENKKQMEEMAKNLEALSKGEELPK